MYLCIDCGALFEEPRRIIETHGLDTPPYEVWNVCPECGGGYVETMRCNICDEWITGDYIELDDYSVVCECCYVVKNIVEDS